MSRYKAAGTNAVDEKGTLDITEFINVSKDDALAFPAVVHRTYPSSVVARMDSTIRPFVEKSVEINNTLINALNAKLGRKSGWNGSDFLSDRLVLFLGTDVYGFELRTSILR